MEWLGGPWGPAQQDAVVGGSLWSCVDYMLGLSGAEVARELVAERLLDGMAERMGAGVALVPGAKELLVEAGEAGVPVVLVTSTIRRLADLAIDAIGRGYFVETVAGDEVAHNKPHPEPYLKAARLIGVDPARCVVLEDSPTGVASGEAAGCAVAVVPGLLSIPEGPGRTLLTSLAETDLERLRSLLIPWSVP